MADIPPNQTIYCSNLPEKIKKEDLKKALYAIFSQFGKILDVVALKTYRLRGQAWVVFADVKSAADALRSMQGFPFFEKPMRITYAKDKSDAVAKAEGSYVPKDKTERQKRNKAERDRLMERGKTKAAGVAPMAVGGMAAPAAMSSDGAPNKILFVQNLPAATTDAMLAMLFQQFPGYVETRMVEARPGIAFVEFENEAQAATSMQSLQNFKITPTNAIGISYAKQ